MKVSYRFLRIKLRGEACAFTHIVTFYELTLFIKLFYNCTRNLDNPTLHLFIRQIIAYGRGLQQAETNRLNEFRVYIEINMT